MVTDATVEIGKAQLTFSGYTFFDGDSDQSRLLAAAKTALLFV